MFPLSLAKTEAKIYQLFSTKNVFLFALNKCYFIIQKLYLKNKYFFIIIIYPKSILNFNKNNNLLYVPIVPLIVPISTQHIIYKYIYS